MSPQLLGLADKRSGQLDAVSLAERSDLLHSTDQRPPKRPESTSAKVRENCERATSALRLAAFSMAAVLALLGSRRSSNPARFLVVLTASTPRRHSYVSKGWPRQVSPPWCLVFLSARPSSQ